MKKFFIAAVAAFALPFSVTAGQLLPNLYAREYCDARDLGMDMRSAARVAHNKAWLSSLPSLPQTVKLGDGKFSADNVNSILAARRRCPQYFS